jgi:hypothetical protein
MHPSNTHGRPDRRRHRMYVTRNTEYHFRDAVCVAVRDRRSGTWLPSHLALRRKLTGGVRLQSNGVAVPSDQEPEVGELLYFGSGGRDLVTSSLCGVERPAKDLVESYPEPSCFVRVDEQDDTCC